MATLRPAPSEAILDVGGWPDLWAEAELPNPICLLNRGFPPEFFHRFPRFQFVTGDGCQLPFSDGEFSIVVSNSVIEHLGSEERQACFAKEVIRVGRKLWIQTPAREFPIEPHYLAPFVHWLPIAWQRRLIRNFTLWGWLDRPTAGQVDAMLAEVRLLRRSEVETLFPCCQILAERFLGLTKSHIAVRS